MSIVYLILLIASAAGLATTAYCTIAVFSNAKAYAGLEEAHKKGGKAEDVDPELKREFKMNAVKHLILAILGFIMFLFSTGPLMNTTTFIIKTQTVGVEVRSTLEDFTPEEIAKVVRIIQSHVEEGQQDK